VVEGLGEGVALADLAGMGFELAPQEELAEVGSHQQALQHRVHVARVPNVLQPHHLPIHRRFGSGLTFFDSLMGSFPAVVPEHYLGLLHLTLHGVQGTVVVVELVAVLFGGNQLRLRLVMGQLLRRALRLELGGGVDPLDGWVLGGGSRLPSPAREGRRLDRRRLPRQIYYILKLLVAVESAGILILSVLPLQLLRSVLAGLLLIEGRAKDL